MHRTTVMLPRDLKERAAREAQARGVSLGELIRDALSRLLQGGADDTLLEDGAVYDGPAPRRSVADHDDLLYGPTKRR